MRNQKKKNSGHHSTIATKSETAMDAIVYNNGGVASFERGSLQKAKRLFGLAFKALRGELEESTLLPPPSWKKRKASRHLKHSHFEIKPSKPFGSKPRRQRKQENKDNEDDNNNDNSNRSSSKKHAHQNTFQPPLVATSSCYLYLHVFLIKTQDSIPIVLQTTHEQLAAIILFNRALVYHLLAIRRKQFQKTLRVYQTAFQACILSDLVFQQVVIWNNLSQIFLSELASPETANLCFCELLPLLIQLDQNGMLETLLDPTDRMGLLFNVAFSHPHLAPAA